MFIFYVTRYYFYTQLPICLALKRFYRQTVGWQYIGFIFTIKLMFSAVFLFTICGLPPEQAEADVNIKISRPWTAGKTGYTRN